VHKPYPGLSLLLSLLIVVGCNPRPTPVVTATRTPASSPVVAPSTTPSQETIFLPAVVNAEEPPDTPQPTHTNTPLPDTRASSLTPTPSVTPLATSTPLPSPTATPNQTPTPSSTPSRTPTPSPTPTPLPPGVFKPGLGVQLHLFGVNVDHVLDWARGTGAEWVKQQVEWVNIEGAPGEYNWWELDRIVSKAKSRDLKLMLSVNHAPAWTRSEAVEYGPPHDPAEFGRFMGVIAGRYAGNVDAYELWNEPNLRREWHGEPLDPALFVALIQSGSQAVRAADPNARVISGGPAVTGINDGETAVDDRVYLRGMVAAGVGQWVDGIGVHPYGFANPPQERWDDPQHRSPSHNNHPSFFFLDTLEDYRAILAEGGLESLPLWVTEFGWPSVDGLGEVDTRGREFASYTTEEQQAEYIVAGFKLGHALEWTGPMILWNLNIATIWGKDRPESAYSLLRPDGSYRPAYLRLRLAEP
jgi:hypothetical protein